MKLTEDRMPLSLDQHLSRALAEHPSAVISEYRLGVLVYRVFREQYRADFTGSKGAAQERRYAFSASANSLLLYGLLSPVGGVAAGAAYTVLGRKPASVGETVCAIDPFAYLSHLSAMETHGLTDRVSRQLYASSPAPKQWRQLAQGQMQRDLGGELDAYLGLAYPPLKRTRMSRVQGVPVEISHRTHLGAFRRVADSELRVATIGRTFIDMLREPDLCGGIHHVLAVYKEHAERNLELIVAEVDQHGSPIDKVRAGYVLEEVCGLEHRSMETWRRHASRGGSRRLVANKEYASTYSEKWMLSINA